MAKEATAAAERAEEAKAKQEEAEQFETRLPDYAISVFHGMGHQGRLPDSLVAAYVEFKGRKDRVQPGPMTAEGYAFVDMLAALSVGTLKLTS